jgi:hypothetical protein
MANLMPLHHSHNLLLRLFKLKTLSSEEILAEGRVVMNNKLSKGKLIH